MSAKPELENLYRLADEFYHRRNDLEQKITELRCEQAEFGRLYDQCLAKARDLELDDKEPVVE